MQGAGGGRGGEAGGHDEDDQEVHTNQRPTYTDAEGKTYCWDPVHQTYVALPDVDEALIAQQQAAYDYKPAATATATTSTKKRPSTADDATPSDGAAAAPEKKKRIRKRKPAKRESTALYVTNLPLDITEKELFDFMTKAGIIKRDPENGEYKLKLYRDERNRPKGDALVVYFKRPSVELAMTILDGGEIRPGHPVKLTEAKFDKKELAAPVKTDAIGKKKKKRKARVNQNEDLSWVDWETRRHVILKNMFDPESTDAKTNPEFYKELKEDIKEEVEKLGEVEVVTVFDRNPQGAVAVKFVEAEAAEKCIEAMNGRWFDKRQVTAEWYDGVSNYKVKETVEDTEKRLDEFGDWLENQSDSEEEEPPAPPLED